MKFGNLTNIIKKAQAKKDSVPQKSKKSLNTMYRETIQRFITATINHDKRLNDTIIAYQAKKETITKNFRQSKDAEKNNFLNQRNSINSEYNIQKSQIEIRRNQSSSYINKKFSDHKRTLSMIMNKTKNAHDILIQTIQNAGLSDIINSKTTNQTTIQPIIQKPVNQDPANCINTIQTMHQALLTKQNEAFQVIDKINTYRKRKKKIIKACFLFFFILIVIVSIYYLYSMHQIRYDWVLDIMKRLQ
jgi:hypothetical protein